MVKRKYATNAERQAAYRERLKQKQVEEGIDWNKPLEPIVSYFERMTDLKTIPEQRITLESMANPNIHNLIGCMGRGFSKTLMGSVFGLWCADELSRYMKQPLDITLISSQPTIYQLLDRIFLAHSELKDRLRTEGKSLEIPKKNFQFKDTLGFVERILPTTRQIRSHRANVVILDEAAGLKDNIIKTALPLVKEPLAKTVWLSTPHRDRSLFNEYVAKLPKGWKLLQYSSELCYWTEAMRKLCKETLSKAEYEIEINAKIPEEKIRTLYNSKRIEECVQEFVSVSGKPDTQLHLGVDFGYERSLSVAILSEWDKAYRNIVEIWSWNKDNVNMLFGDLARIINTYDSRRKRLIVFADSKPSGMVDQLKGICPNKLIYSIDKSSKLEGYDVTIKDMLITQTKSLIDTRHLRIANKHDILIKQLKNYTRGRVYNCDYVDALFLSVGNIPITKKVTGDMRIFKVPYDPYFKFTPKGKRGIL